MTRNGMIREANSERLSINWWAKPCAKDAPLLATASYSTKGGVATVSAYPNLAPMYCTDGNHLPSGTTPPTPTIRAKFTPTHRGGAIILCGLTVFAS